MGNLYARQSCKRGIITLLKGLGIAAGSMVALAASILAIKRYQVFSSCASFYQKAEVPFEIPDINSGFVPQDMFYLEEEQIWLFSGYMDNGKPSPIYKLYCDGRVNRLQRLELQLPDGSMYTGHGAAITVSGDYGFVTVNDGYVILHKNELLEASDGEVLHAFDHIRVDLEPAFMTVQQGVFYIGEFYHPIAYETAQSHWLECPDGSTNPALTFAYALNDGKEDDGPYGFKSKPTAIYSIPGDIQGMCITDQHLLVLSQSWGASNSHILTYDMNCIVQQGTFELENSAVPLYFLDNNSLIKNEIVPPMSEGICAVGNKVYLPNESASNKYIFGKFLKGKNVYSFEV